MIEYRDIYKAWDLPVLSGVSLRVEKGEMFGIFGPSGTGKSVLLKTTIALITTARAAVFASSLVTIMGPAGMGGRL